MTYFTVALDSGQLAKLRGTGSTNRSYRCDQLVFLCPNAPVFNARINGAITGGPTGSVVYDTVTFGVYTDIKIGQRVTISPTNNIMDRNAITDRIRATPTSTILYINEVSVDIADNSYIFVTNDYPLMDRLARPDPANPTTVQFKDYDLTFELLPPMVAGIQMSYVQRVDPDTGVATFSLDASASYPTDNSSFVDPLASFLWEFDDSGAINVIGGGTNQDNIEFEIDEGFQWGHLTIEDSVGTLTTFHFQIHPWGDVYTPVLGFEGASINDDIQSGFGVSAIAFTSVSTVLDNTWMTIVRNPEYYNNVLGQIVNGDAYYVDFVGFLSTETSNGKSDELYTFVSDVSFEVTGIGQRLAQIAMQAIGMRNQNSPAAWDYIEQMQPWRSVVHVWARHSTASTLIPLVFTDDVKNTAYTYPYFNTPLGGNLLSSINYILNGINAALEFWPNGTVEGVRDLRYISESNRPSYLTLINLTNVDFFDIAIAWQHIPPTGKVYAEGGSYNNVTAQVTAYKAIAPGTAQGIGSGTGTLGQQILTVTAVQIEGQSELNQRAGNYFAIMNDDGNTLTLSVPGGYDAIFYASRNVLYTLTYDDAVRGVSYDASTKFMCIGKSSQHNNEMGAREAVSVTLQRLIPFAAPGDTIPQIAENDIALAIPDLPPFPAFNSEFPEFSFPLSGLDLSQVNPTALNNPPGQAAKTDGSVLMVKSDTQSYLISNAIILTTPQSYEITPSDTVDFDTKQVLFDPLNVGSNKPTANKRAYELKSDGTNSHVQRTENIWARPPIWLTGDDIAGLYNVVRGTNVDGGLITYSPTAVPIYEHSFDFTVSNGGWSIAPGYAAPFPTYTPGSGWTSTNDGVSPGAGGNTVQIVSASAFEITGIDIAWNADVNNPGSNARRIEVSLGGAGMQTFLLGNATGPQSASFSPSGSVDTILVSVDAGNNGSPPYHSTIISVTIRSANTNPFGGSSTNGAGVRYSDDKGDTFAPVVFVGETPGDTGGFDVSRASGVSYAACAGKVRKASSLGGAYSDFVGFTGANPTAVCIPYFRLGSTTTKQTTASDPDLIVGLDQTDSDGGTFYKVNGATAAKTAITPVAGMTFDSPNCITTSYGTHIAVIGVVGGVRKLYTSTDTGATWTLRLSGLSSNAQFIRTRRGDNRVKKYSGGDHGQLFVINGSTLSYSVDWGANFDTRNLPIACNGMDILG